jgi:predicted RNA-binding protein with PUA domain
MGKNREIAPEGSTPIYWCTEHSLSTGGRCCEWAKDIGWLE